MNARLQHFEFAPVPAPSPSVTDPITLERQILAAGLQVKQLLCSRLLGEISEQQYDSLKTCFLEQYRALERVWRECGYERRELWD